MSVTVAADLVRRPLLRAAATARSLRSRAESERGANLVEYLLLLTFIAIVVIAIVIALGSEVSEKYSGASSTLLNAG